MVVGAHFFTDIVSGGLLALIIFKVLNSFINENYKNFSFTEYEFKNNSQLYYFLILLLGSVVFLTVGPSLDLYISNLFYHGNSQFSLQSYNILSKIFREFFLPLLLVYILIFPIIVKLIKVEKVFFGRTFSFKEIVLIWSSQVLVVLIFVNVILKNLIRILIFQKLKEKKL